MKPFLGRLALALLAAGMLAPGVSLAQIPSGSQAGGNSGNGASGSSNSPISTPSFTPVTPVSNIPGVEVSSLSQITATPPQITAMQSAVQNAAGVSPLFAQIVATTVPTQIVAGPEAQLTSVTVNNVNNFETSTSFLELPSVVSRSLNLATPIIVVNSAIGVSGQITTSSIGGVVTVQLPTASPLQITTTPETTLAVVQFAAIATAAGLTTTSIQAGVQILPLLLPIAPSSVQAANQAVQLLAAVQGLAGQSNLANLNQAVTTWNQLISTASDAQLLALAANSTFTGIGDVLRAAATGLAGF